MAEAFEFQIFPGGYGAKPVGACYTALRRPVQPRPDPRRRLVLSDLEQTPAISTLEPTRAVIIVISPSPRHSDPVLQVGIGVSAVAKRVGRAECHGAATRPWAAWCARAAPLWHRSADLTDLVDSPRGNIEG